MAKKKTTRAQRWEIVQRNKLARQKEAIYQKQLMRKREAALKSALNELKGNRVDDFEEIISNSLDEPYLDSYYNSLYKQVGLLVGKDARESVLKRVGTKASNPNWMQSIIDYTEAYTGSRIVIVKGAFKAEVIDWLRDAIVAAPEMGIEQVTKLIYQDILESWNGVKEWEVRRIVQTESMAARAVGQDAAVRSLNIKFNKQWTATFNNTREQHAEMDGVIVDMDEPFILPNGDFMMYPSDFSMGASAENLINCSCGVFNEPKI